MTKINLQSMTIDLWRRPGADDYQLAITIRPETGPATNRTNHILTTKLLSLLLLLDIEMPITGT